MRNVPVLIAFLGDSRVILISILAY